MKLITANRLNDGVVVWLSKNGWCEDAALAHAFEDEESQAELNKWQARESEVVGVYTIALSPENEPVKREHIREMVRANGPTIGPSADEIAKQLRRGNIFN